MMKKTTQILLPLLLVAIGSYTYAQPADSIKIQRSLINFTRLHVEGPFEVTIRQGAVDSVGYKVPAVVSDRLVVEVDGSTLHIRNKHDNWSAGEKSWWSSKSWWHTHPRVKLYITVRNLEAVKASGSCNLLLDGSITTTSLKLVTRGSASISGDINVQTLNASIAGSGLIKLSGQCETVETHISGSGTFSAKNLVTAKTGLYISGSGHADINANTQVNARLHGSASVAYTGDANISSKKSGDAEITRF
jgi:hypothetical protein